MFFSKNFKDFLKQRFVYEAFVFWCGAHEPHRVYEYGSGLKAGKSIENIEVPDFLPDTEIVRNDMLDYILEIEHFDNHLQQMIEHLEEIGELDNTFILVTADNGMPFPYAKANVQEYGTHVPLAISFLTYSGVTSNGRFGPKFSPLWKLPFFTFMFFCFVVVYLFMFML